MSSSDHRNIYIVGAQCTGKTTLVKALEEYYTTTQTQSNSWTRPVIVTEVARSVLRRHAIPAADIRASPDRALNLQRLILDAQVSAERQALGRGTWFISDRSGIDPTCYAFTYAGREGVSLLLASEEWGLLKSRMKQAMIVVCEAGADWLYDDGVRLMPLDRDEWIRIHDVFCTLMDGLGLSYVVLPAKLTDLSARVGFVLSRH
ncbi:hypothetical protein LX32DRAFT_720980 [Colletotrichum zoysiae]|uniref:NadR/Ttd14 AAA domain-containing protein n=1 Tax=Colletotrichum zoysiae TaxID=1216348 RepID=A0AAD9HFX2_9PEZI|nr:hypothetical protein LX32DRAFT_720980 [Colletotrichum zoysiae]